MRLAFSTIPLALSLITLAGCSCGDGSITTADAGLGVDGGRTPDAATLPDGSAPDAGPGPDAGPPPPEDVRFVVMGDTGEGNESQRAVAVAIRELCATEGCDFVLLLGDNIYEAGVESVDDEQWQTKFEIPYADVDLPFYAVLGNHDYGGSLLGIQTGGLGNEWERGPIEVQYTMRSERWEMPATHYTLTFGNVGIIMLDTNSIVWGDTRHGDQRAWYAEALREVEGSDWVIVAGHHPYLSNGQHGNAGDYESIEVGGVEVPNPVPVLDGENLRTFYDAEVCGTADVVLAGHDHNLQWMDEPDALCGAELIVSGAGCKTTAFASELNTTHFQDDTTPGFLYVVIEGDTFTGRFVDQEGRMMFERSVTRTER